MATKRVQPKMGTEQTAAGGLIERETELAHLRESLARAASGTGSVTYLESAAGTGRSALLDVAAAMADEAGACLLRARCRETERRFPFAVALQLLEEPWLSSSATDGAHQLFPGPSELAPQLSIHGRPVSANARPEDRFGAIHGLFWTLRKLAVDGGQPLAIVVDDVPRADAASLQFLAYLAVRVGELPIALFAAARAGEPGSDPEALGSIRAAAAVLRPADLSTAAAQELVRAELSHPQPTLWKSCAELTGGNPFQLRALLDDLRGAPPQTGAASAAVGELVPEAVVTTVKAQLSPMAPEARATAWAVAVLGGGVTLTRTAPVADLSVEATARAADALAEAGLLRSGAPLSFTTPLLTRAVLRSIPELQRELLQRRGEKVNADAALPETAAGIPAATGGTPSVDERVRLVQMAIESSHRGEHRMRVRKLGELAWGDGALWSADSAEPMLAVRLAEALLEADELELGLEILGDGGERVLEPADPEVARVSASVRGWVLYHRGEISAALTTAEAGLRLMASSAEPAHGLRGVVAACHAARGEFDQAADALRMLQAPEKVSADVLPVLFDLRAQLALLRGRPAEALADALEAGRRTLALSASRPGRVAWRSTAALARLALDEPGAAQQLAQEELDLARTGDSTRATVRALRVLGLASSGRRRLDLLEDAAALGAEAPVRLEYLHALVDLGAASRRANRRAAAREPLIKAAELARELGAAAIAERAQEELSAGAGRRRRQRSTGTEALTPSERRVALLAAQGRTTRQIAGELYVTPKTVEFHLRHVYRKLEVPSTRADLTRALLGEDAVVSHLQR